MNPKIFIGVGAAIAWTAFVIWATSRYKDKAFKEFLKKHDKETAERLSKQFEKEIEAVKEKCNEDKETYKRKVNDICRKYGIPPVA